MENHEELIDYYEKKLKKHQHGSLAVDWNCQEAQELLFFALIDGLDKEHLKSGKAKILDVGCGLGALYGFLNRLGYKVQYTGIDIAPGMIEACKKQYPEASFEVRDLLLNPYPEQSFDYVFLSGSVSLKIHDHERYVRRMIHRMYSFAKVALSFNVLSSRAMAESRTFQLDDLRYYPQPYDILQYCQSFTPFVNMRHDAASYTFTMQLFRKQDISAAIINEYVAYLEKQNSKDADDAINNTLLEVGAIQRTLDRVPFKGDSADYWNFRAVCLARLGRQSEQAEALDKALSLNPDHEWANLNKGTIAHFKGDFDTARRSYEETLKLDPDNKVARSQLLYIMINQGEEDAAKKLLAGFKEAAEHDFFLGEFYYLTGFYRKAYKAYSSAQKKAPYLAESFRKMALCAKKFSDTKKELSCWHKVLEKLPYDQQARHWLANYYYENNQFKKVIDFTDLIVFDVVLVELRGRAFYNLNQPLRAKEAFIENVTDSNSISSLLDLAELAIENGRHDDCLVFLEKAENIINQTADNSWQDRINIIKNSIKMATGCDHCE